MGTQAPRGAPAQTAMALLRTRTRSTVQDLARRFALETTRTQPGSPRNSGFPAAAGTPGAGPAGTVPMDAAADALAVVEALAESAPSRGHPVDTGPAARRHRLADPQVLDLVAEQVEAAADLAAFDM
jgi:hypothetical protein